jgi:hypothetical protein
MLVLPMEGFLNYADEIVSCGMIFIPGFIKIDTGVRAV